MPANTNPIFAEAPKQPSATIAAANTARDGSGTLVTLFTAGSDGARIDSIVFTSAQATAAASATKVFRVFVSDNAGANPRLRAEVASTGATASTTAIGQTATITFTNGLLLEPNQIVYVTQSVYASAADQTHVFAQGGNY